MIQKLFHHASAIFLFSFSYFGCCLADSNLDALVRCDANYTSISLQKTVYFLNEDTPYEEGKEENNGILITVLNERTGKPMIQPEHLQPAGDLNWIIRFLNKIQRGRIVIFALRGDLSYVVPLEFTRFLKESGSLGISFLGRGMTWSWAFVNGGKTLFEVVSFPSSFKMAPTTETHISSSLSNTNEVRCPEWPDGPHWKMRRRFCDKYEKYGDLCWCHDPHTLKFNSPEIENNQIGTAVSSAIVNRGPSFYESLKTLLPNPGFNKSRFEVFVQERRPELVELLNLFEIPLTITGIKPNKNVANTIMKQFIFAYVKILQKYPEAEFFVFLEDDLHFSPDFYIFLNRTAELLVKDPTLYCASAHNDLSYPHTSYDATAVLRTESYPNYGWMVRREFVLQMIKGLQNVLGIEADWDIVTFHYLRGTKECIIPEVSRSHHFSEGGFHISQYQAKLYFFYKNYNLDPNALVTGVERLEKNSYELFLADLLKQSVALDLTKYRPCSEEFYDALNSLPNSVIAIYFQLDDLAHYRGTLPYFILVECLDVYPTESRESHFGLFRLRWREKHLLLIGVPASNYSSYKPEGFSVFNGSDTLSQEARSHIANKTPSRFFVLDAPSNYLKEFQGTD